MLPSAKQGPRAERGFDQSFDQPTAARLAAATDGGWTGKEAFIKAIGLGFRYPLDRVVVADLDAEEPHLAAIDPPYGPPSSWTLHTRELPDGCQLAVAAKIPRAVVKLEVATAESLSDSAD